MVLITRNTGVAQDRAGEGLAVVSIKQEWEFETSKVLLPLYDAVQEHTEAAPSHLF